MMFRNSFCNLVTRGRQNVFKIWDSLEKTFSTPSNETSQQASNSNVNCNNETPPGKLHATGIIADSNTSVSCPFNPQSAPNLNSIVWPNGLENTENFQYPSTVSLPNSSTSNFTPESVTTTTSRPTTTTAPISLGTAVTMSTTTTTAAVSSLASTFTSLPHVSVANNQQVPPLIVSTSQQGSGLLQKQPELSQPLQETTFLEGLKSLLSLQLPKLDIEKFDGDRKKYEKFKLRFSTLITSCNVLPCHRATLLYKALSDAVIDQLDSIYDLQKPDTYDKIWHSLDNEFSQTNFDVIFHVSELESIQKWEVCETSAELYRLYKFLRYHYNVLKHHGQEWQAEVSKLHVLGKLKGEVADKCFDSGLFGLDRDQPVIPEMLSIIRKEVDLLKLQEIANVAWVSNNEGESSSGGGYHFQKQNQPKSKNEPCTNTNNSQTVQNHNKPLLNYRAYVKPFNVKTFRDRLSQGKLDRFKYQCFFCMTNTHDSDQCRQYADPTKFRRILFDYQLCFNCLGQGHRSFECMKPQMCSKNCDDVRKHASVICPSVG